MRIGGYHMEKSAINDGGEMRNLWEIFEHRIGGSIFFKENLWIVMNRIPNLLRYCSN